MKRREAGRTAAGYKALQRMTAAIRSQVDLGRVLDTLAADTGRLLDLSLCSVARWDASGRCLVFGSEYRRDPDRASALSLSGRRFEPGAEPSAKWLENLLFKEHLSLISSKADASNLRVAILAALSDSSFVVTPMLAGQRVMGLLAAVRSRELPAWSEEEVEFLRAAADLAAVAIQHAALRSQLRVMASMSAEINSRLGPRALLRRLTEAAMSLTQSSLGMSGSLEGGEALVCREVCRDGTWESVELRFARGQGMPGWAWANRAPCLANDARSDPRAQPDLVLRFSIRSALTIPIVNRDGEVVGFFEMHDKAAGAPYGDEDVHLVSALAHQAALSLPPADRDTMLAHDEATGAAAAQVQSLAGGSGRSRLPEDGDPPGGGGPHGAGPRR